MRFDDDFRLLSQPVRLHWAGWETDTYRLQRAGWAISAEQDFMRQGMRFALRSPNGDAYGMTNLVHYEFGQQQRGFGPIDLGAQLRLGRDIQVHETGPFDFRAVDALPQMVERRVRRLEDLAHFAAPLVRTQEIVVPEESVADLMDRILKMQQPDRTERIRQSLRNPEGYRMDTLPAQKFHAQIISFPAAA